MSSISEDNAKQYGDSRKLAARARLHKEYTIAEIGWFAWVAKQLPLKSGDRVLDIGCGPGWFWAATTRLLPDGLDLTLADLSPGMADEAMKRCQSLSFGSLRSQPADAAALPFDDGSFDIVIAMHMLYHLPNPAAGIAEMYRVLKPGGFLAVTTNDVSNLRDLYALTTVFGSAPVDPAGVAFGYDTADQLMRSQFGNVTLAQHPACLRITDPEDVFLALTSYPPGDEASEAQLIKFREAIGDAFEKGGGMLEAKKEAGLFLSRKSA
jgi:ubiquinone/menaquinone biosynthesis C-methylase UbiE